jgi:hypothetical protein
MRNVTRLEIMKLLFTDSLIFSVISSLLNENVLKHLQFRTKDTEVSHSCKISDKSMI